MNIFTQLPNDLDYAEGFHLAQWFIDQDCY